MRGKVLDKQTNEALQFVNVKVTPAGSDQLVKGGITDATGSFNFTGLQNGSYVLTATFVGYKTATRNFTVSQQKPHHNFPVIYLGEDSQTLKEVQVTGQRSQMKLEVDRKTFSVDNVLAAAGASATELLEQIPSIEVTTDGEMLNYTRRLRRPWGGQLNNFKNTRDATMVEFGNPELTPEFSNSFSLNYLKTWPEHTLSISTYYRPTTDVIQRIRYQGDDGLMYSTSENVTKNQRAGVELIVKDKLFRILDLTTTVNGYYYKLDGFSYNIMGQTITGESDENFSWDARLLASLILPYDISQQTTGNYRSRGVITQGYRKANGSVDLGLRKTFLNKTLALAINWRDVFKLARRVQHPPLRELHLERHLHPSPEELA